jgi:hypothetical protein
VKRIVEKTVLEFIRIKFELHNDEYTLEVLEVQNGIFNLFSYRYVGTPMGSI